MKILNLMILLLGAGLSTTWAETAKDQNVMSPPNATETKEERDKRMAWFREARFGMFIHWGVYAVQAKGEWGMCTYKVPVATYKTYAPKLTAANYDPDAWAALAKRAGMRYVVITSKHHDGFAMFDSAASDWNAVKASGAKRDLIAPLEKAVRAQGLRFGLYYSQSQDWVNGGASPSENWKMWDPAQIGDYDEYLTKIAAPQVEELLTKFRPDILWWDTPIRMTKERGAPFIPVLAKYPDLIMNDRHGSFPGDTHTPEQHIPPRGYPGQDFEVCMTMNRSWGIHTEDKDWKSVNRLLRNLSDISSKGGNFLLNVGPTADGVIPQENVERLEAMGKWMAVNGEAIYGTQASPFAKRLVWGRATRKPDVSSGGETLYLHVWNWPTNGKLTVPHAGQEGVTATLLATKSSLPVAINNGDLVLEIPATAPDADISVIALRLPKPLVDKGSELPSPDANGVVHLGILDADCIGTPHAGNIEITGSDDKAYLGPWSHPWMKMGYALNTPKAQDWLVQAEIVAVAPVGLKILAGKTVVPCTVPATGGEGVWQTMDLGRINLPSGKTNFTFVAEEKNWKSINVRNVTLRPAPIIETK